MKMNLISVAVAICAGLVFAPVRVLNNMAYAAVPPEIKTAVKSPSTVARCEAQITAFPPESSSECCGKAVAVGNKIVGANGMATLIDEHPWAVVIEYINKKDSSTSLHCGGSLISSKYVLTAAHCITGQILKYFTPVKVRLGEFDTSNEGEDCVEAAGGGEDCTDGAISFDIEKTISHPQFNGLRNDIGLIRFKGTAPYTDFIRPICLPNKDLTLPENTPSSFWMYAVGWGRTEYKLRSDVKIQIHLPYVRMEDCQPELQQKKYNVSLWRGQLCAGAIRGEDSCKGDSGGPLAYENNGKFQLIGIISSGPEECGTEGLPGIYTNVYEYLEWIKGIIVE